MNKNLFPIFAILFSFWSCSETPPDGESRYQAFAPDGIPFTIADSSWNVDGVGNHRAVVVVNHTKQDAVQVTLPWRRPDMRPDTKRIIVVDAASGQEVKNVSIINFSAEKGVIAFQPQTVSGRYYVYYLPYTFRTGWNDARYGKPWNDYLPPEYATDPEWEKAVKNDLSAIPEAKLERFETRSRFDFFTSMGLIATKKEMQTIKEKHPGDFILFPEDRAYPVRLKTIPVRWASKEISGTFEGYALPNEYYTWQIGVWASQKKLKNIRLAFSDLTLHSGKGVIRSEEITCFNLEGINWNGQPVKFDVDVPEDTVQVLWCGVQIPETAQPGKYTGTITVSAENAASQVIEVIIHTGKGLIADKGDGDLWRHARLRWLNSTIGTDRLPVAPYEKMQLDGNKITATGKTVWVNTNGLPQAIEINGCQLFEKSMEFIVSTGNGNLSFTADHVKIEQTDDGLVQWKASSIQDGLKFDCEAGMEYDGYIRYHVKLSADREIAVTDIRLVTSYTPVASEYFMGTGYKGGTRPADYTWDWKGPWDSYWTGGYRAGLHVEFRGGTYHGPLINDYKPAPPGVWENAGKGRIHVSGNPNSPASMVVSTGKNIISDTPLDFEFALLITPVKPLNTAKHFSERYFHSLSEDFAQAAEEGANIANIHHSRSLNPVINYPFIVREPLVEYIQTQQEANRKVKLYYTIRELTNYTAEIHALKSLNHEIFVSGVGYGLPWHCEHLIDDYKPAWYTELPGQNADAALVLNGFSRWINYYLEGLRWMFENYKIDGIYMDDVSFDREVMKRMRKIMAQYRPEAVIDLHSNTGYSIGPANQYTDFFPYIDRLWFGESFRYNQMMPDEWLVTFSGIPFGVMSEMLQDGGNRFLGMVYGATARHSYGPYSPAPVWNLWKSFGIEDAQMIGYWDEACPVKTSHPKVKVTAYVRQGKTLLSIGNFDAADQSVRLSFDWRKLGINPSEAVLHAPLVENFQNERTFKIDEPVPVKSKEGWLLIVSGK
ncbi:MAG: DUF6067 family protein [Tannerella sp.]|jgi:hypothetical protein|nr:DUF6067 family protein [Tannerella sp.]